MKRVIAVRSGGDWTDACCDHLNIATETDLVEEVKKYDRWYHEEYCAELHKAGGSRPYEVEVHLVHGVPYMTFTEWLIARCGATKADIEEVER